MSLVSAIIRLRSVAAGLTAAILHHPRIRYGLLLPLSREILPDHDERLLSLAMEFAAHNTDGDYLEFGVWKGRSFAKAFHIWDRFMRRKGKLRGMRFYAFDSFQGLPDVTSVEDRSTGEFKKGDYAYSEENFKGALKSRGVDGERVTIVPGWYSETLNQATREGLPIRSASIIFIDCDLYESTVPVLNFITDYVVDGTVVIFDDWFCYKGNPDKGEQKAFREWLDCHPDIRATEWQKVNWKTNSFILHRNA